MKSSLASAFGAVWLAGTPVPFWMEEENQIPWTAKDRREKRVTFEVMSYYLIDSSLVPVL